MAASWPFSGETDSCAGGELAQDGGKKAGAGFSLRGQRCVSPPVFLSLAGRTDMQLEWPGKTRGAESKVPAPGAGTGRRPRARSTPAWPTARPMAQVSQCSWEVAGTDLGAAFGGRKCISARIMDLVVPGNFLPVN